MRKFLWMSLCIGLLASCELFESKEDKAQKLVNEELLGIDWNDVDQYPHFDSCDELAVKEAQRQCFQTVMIDTFSKALSGLKFQVQHDLNDTVYVDFLIDEHGFISVLNVEEKTSVLNEIADFNAKITARLNDLTTVAPALKRGNPVSLRFRLPLVLNTN
ncbi:hypothetical protein [Flagellimonas beolgyonensis]|uniref:hypothetical protein n=1 Tax=Flagellimonas beolgyonensis TaxID=864064 RepID=UPI003D64BE67